MKKLAFVGCAHIHTPDFVRRVGLYNGAEVIAVWDHDRARAKKNAELLHSKVVATADEIWNNREIGAVIICSETNLHRELVLKAAAAGKDIYAEKPLGCSAEDAREMAEAIKKAGVVFQTGYFRRGDPINLFLREQIKKGAFGTITRARHCNCHSGSLGGWFDTDWRWMADPKVAGCGAFGDLGTHSLDILMWFFGVPESCTASIRQLTGRYPGCDEYGEGMLQYKDGMIATLAAGWVDAANPIDLEICGTKGHATVVGRQLYFTSSLVPGADKFQPWTDLPTALPHAFDLFLDKVVGDKDVPLVSVEDAASRNIVMDTLYKAAEAKTWLKI